ncbi:MAG: hypothetical protein Kow00109_02690 [Acidobacteriota bacterium]
MFFLPNLALAAGTQNEADLAPPPEVITVTAEPVPATAIPGTVTVVTREEIVASGAANLGDLLQVLPAVHVNRVGGWGGKTTVTLRGGEPNHTLVMINGIPLNDLTDSEGGAYDLNGLGLAGVERIEIVAGPLSGLYGSDAVAGVVNVILRGARERRSGEVAAEGGNFGRRGVAASVGAAGRRWDLALAADWREIGQQVLLEDYGRKEATGTGGWRIARLGDFRLTGRLADWTSQGLPPNGGGPLYSVLKDPARRESRERLVGLQWFRGAGGEWRMEAGFDWMEHELDADTPAILDGLPPGPASLPSSRGQSTFRRHRFQAAAHWFPQSELQASFFAQLRREAGESDFFLADVLPSCFSLERTTWAVGTELFVHRDRWSGLVGLRTDRVGSRYRETSPRASVKFLLVPSYGLEAGAAWSEGFKLPSFYALGEPNVGNPDLVPEKSRSLELSLAWRAGVRRPRLVVTGFRTTYRDLVDFSPALFRLVNRSAVRATGVEVTLARRLEPRLGLSGYVRYVNLENENSPEPLRDRPKWRGGGTVEWTARPGTRLRADVTLVGKRYDFQLPVPRRQIAEGYGRVALSWLQRIGEGLELVVRADNLLDDEYEAFVGFPDPGLAWSAQLRYGFSWGRR